LQHNCDLRRKLVVEVRRVETYVVTHTGELSHAFADMRGSETTHGVCHRSRVLEKVWPGIGKGGGFTEW